METTVGQVLNRKASDRILTIDGRELVVQALRTMEAYDVGALVVVEHNDVVGLVSERDYARKVALQGRTSRTTRVREIMSEAVFVSPEIRIGTCRSLMTEKRLRHICVEEDGTLLGVISLGDVVKEVASDQAFMIDQLTWYIAGPPVPGRHAPPSPIPTMSTLETKVVVGM